MIRITNNPNWRNILFHTLQLKNNMVFKFFPERQFLLLKSLSHGTEVAEMHKYFECNLYNSGRVPFISFQKLNVSLILGKFDISRFCLIIKFTAVLSMITIFTWDIFWSKQSHIEKSLSVILDDEQAFWESYPSETLEDPFCASIFFFFKFFCN